MNTRKVFFGILACAVLMLASCTSDSTSADDELFEQGIEKSRITRQQKK